ncbi:MAG TPA: protein kinase [Candidatus Acidoferrales bacterium]|nr:protein kinase [Candidatus Acidoferrales bacterium]
MALPAASKLGPYEIVAALGAGGMGEVYRAVDTRLGRSVAIKVLPEHAADSQDALQRFQREARSVSSLNHPNICTLYDIGHDEGRDFIVMECLEGETLAQRIRRGPLSVRETVDIALPVARGLAEAHAQSVVHRDIKPSNIILTRQGVPKIIDFGLARLVSANAGTQTLGVTTGTIGYMSPEQTLGRPVTASTDVWAVGVLLIEMLNGANPFQRENASAILFAIVNEPPATPASAPPELQKIIYRALSKDPAGRYADCGEMAEDLETFRSSVISSAGMQPVNDSAPTATLRSGEVKKYIERASASAWAGTAAPAKKASRWWLPLVALVLLGAVALAFPAVRERMSGVLFGSTEKHIAVLPFDNIGNNPGSTPLAEGLMDSLTSILSNLDVGNQSLWVVPSSVVRARKVADPSAALRELGATLVVEGSIQREGRDIRLTVNLVNTKTLRQIGSAQLEDPAGDLATLQNEAVSRLSKLMGISVTADMLKNTGGKANPAAYQSYLTALGYIQRYDKPGNLDSAISALNDAVKTDPSFALGYAELADAYRHKYGLDPNQKWIDEATANCATAARLDPNIPAVHITLARTYAMVEKYDLSLEEFQRALRLDPHNSDALQGLAGTYERMGRIREAEEAFKRAIALRPDYWDGYNSLGLFYDRQRRYPEAIAELRRVIQLTPDNAAAYSNLASFYLDMGDAASVPLAEQALKKSIELSPSYNAYANLGILYLDQKRYAESAAATEKALQLNDKNYLVWDNLVIAYRWLKQKDKAEVARTREIALLQEEAKTHPQDAMVQSNLAVCYAEKGDRQQAMTHVESALALAPEDATILVNAGETYEDLGDRPMALKYTEQGLKKGYPLAQLQNDPEVQELLRDPNFRPTEKK